MPANLVCVTMVQEPTRYGGLGKGVMPTTTNIDLTNEDFINTLRFYQIGESFHSFGMSYPV